MPQCSYQRRPVPFLSVSTVSNFLPDTKNKMDQTHQVPTQNEEMDHEKPAEEKISFTHEELVQITVQTLRNLFEVDSLLSDLPSDVTLDEVTAQLALQHGQSMKLHLNKGNGQELPIVVRRDATVKELKDAVKRHVVMDLKRKGEKCKISWKYIWRVNYLSFDGKCLDDDSASLTELGVGNRSDIFFTPRRRDKARGKRK